LVEVAEIVTGDRNGAAGEDFLGRLSIDGDEARSQNLVVVDDRVKGSLLSFVFKLSV
jgi:hypothetical protein